MNSAPVPRVADLFGGPVTLLDLETTGATPAVDRITEIGLVELAADDPLEAAGQTWSQLVDPGQPIPPFIARLTGIDDAMVEGAPAFARLAAPLAERLRGRLLIAHNVRFDYAFLRAEFARAGIAFSASVLCSARLSRRLYPEQHRHNLDAVIARHGLTCTARHRALGDARVLSGFLHAATVDRGAALVREAAAALIRPAEATREAADYALELPEGPGCAVLLDAQGVALCVIAGARLRADVLRELSRPGPQARDLLGSLARIQWEPHAGALGAALGRLRLESRLQPCASRADRGVRESWRLAWTAGETPAFRLCQAHREAIAPDAWFGDFADESTARRVLATIARSHRLCLPLLGIASPPVPPGRCASAVEDRCARACPGEAGAARAGEQVARALAALRRLPTPPALPAGLHAWLERSPAGDGEIHLFEGPRHLGSVGELADLPRLLDAPREEAPVAARLLEAALQSGTGALERVRIPHACVPVPPSGSGRDPTPDPGVPAVVWTTPQSG